MQYDLKQISGMLADRAEDVCRWLLPNGRRNGAEWEAGSVGGEAGKSLKVNLAGKKGVWKDFAADGDGDLLDLIAAVKGRSMAEAVREAKDFLGIKETTPHFTTPKQAKQFQRPKLSPAITAANGPVLDFFQKRGIGPETVNAFKIGALEHQAKGTTIVFPYVHDDAMLFVKYRPVADKKGMWTSKDSEPCLFGWQAMPENARTLVIVEGELDAMAMYQGGYCAVSVPRGGGDGAKQDGWIATEWERLQLFDAIYLALDNDEQGQKAAEYIAQRLGQHRCYYVDFGVDSNGKPIKDANDFLLAGGDFTALFANAKTLDPPELQSAADFTEDVINYFENGDMLSGDPLPWAKSAQYIRLRPSEVSIWAGVNGHGKSQIIGHVMAHSVGLGQRWCVASMELPPHKLLARLYRQTSGQAQPSANVCRYEIADYFDGKLFLFNVQGTAKAKRILEVFDYAHRRYGCTHFLIDSLAKCGFNEDGYNDQKTFIDSLADFALKNALHVHLVCHSRKYENEDRPPNKMDIKGTGALTDMVDNVFTVWRNKPKERNMATAKDNAKRVELMASPDCVLECCKQRHGEWEGGISLWFDRASLQYLEGPEQSARALCDIVPNI